MLGLAMLVGLVFVAGFAFPYFAGGEALGRYRGKEAWMQATGIGSLREQQSAASWFCWAAPLLVTEAILQGRKIFAR